MDVTGSSASPKRRRLEAECDDHADGIIVVTKWQYQVDQQRLEERLNALEGKLSDLVGNLQALHGTVAGKVDVNTLHESIGLSDLLTKTEAEDTYAKKEAVDAINEQVEQNFMNIEANYSKISASQATFATLAHVDHHFQHFVTKPSLKAHLDNFVTLEALEEKYVQIVDIKADLNDYATKVHVEDHYVKKAALAADLESRDKAEAAKAAVEKAKQAGEHERAAAERARMKAEHDRLEKEKLQREKAAAEQTQKQLAENKAHAEKAASHALSLQDQIKAQQREQERELAARRNKLDTLDAASRKKEEELLRVAAKAQTIDFEVLGVASKSTKDDLQEISGIGPFCEDKLNMLGIYSFLQLSKMTPKIEEKVNVAIEFFLGRVKRDEWAKQAKQFVKDAAKKSAVEAKRTSLSAASPRPVGRPSLASTPEASPRATKLLKK